MVDQLPTTHGRNILCCPAVDVLLPLPQNSDGHTAGCQALPVARDELRWWERRVVDAVARQDLDFS
jgi:hypothetical protein